MKKLIWMSILGLSLGFGAVFACTSGEVQDHAVELNTKLEQLAEIDPAKASDISTRLQEESIKQAESAEQGSPEQKCELYARLIAEIDEALS